jgi:hypothetical protein
VRGDLRIRSALRREARNPRLQRGQLVEAFDAALADRLAGGEQLVCAGARASLRRCSRCSRSPYATCARPVPRGPVSRQAARSPHDRAAPRRRPRSGARRASVVSWARVQVAIDLAEAKVGELAMLDRSRCDEAARVVREQSLAVGVGEYAWERGARVVDGLGGDRPRERALGRWTGATHVRAHSR